jgi:hypothetical protein
MPFYAAAVTSNPPTNRYPEDVLAPGRAAPRPPASPPLAVERGQVLEDVRSGFCGAVVGWENGLVVLADRHERRRSFPLGAGFWHEGKPVTLVQTRPKAKPTATRTASGSRTGAPLRARTALPSRIYVEGRHDAELVEKIWGDDLRHVGVVVEFLGGIDDLPAVVAGFAPERGRRLGVLVDHLVTASKESRIAAAVQRGQTGEFVMVAGHPYVDVWQAVRPERLGLPAWPAVPRGTDWKHGICAALGWPHTDQADIAAAWQRILARVRDWGDLERPLLTTMEQLVDFVTQDHAAAD